MAAHWQPVAFHWLAAAASGRRPAAVNVCKPNTLTVRVKMSPLGCRTPWRAI
jgi:hypothetical protein